MTVPVRSGSTLPVRAHGARPQHAAAPPFQPHVAFVVDHPARDLGGLVLTAATLAQAGVVCHLVPLNLVQGQLWALAPDLVVLNYARPGNAPLARALLDAGIRIAVLDTEGAAWEDCDAYGELLWTDPALLGALSVACMWGPTLARHLVTRGLLTEGQVAVTGCPRFDFYHPRWRRVATEGRNGTRPCLLINTNFSFSNPRFASAARNWEQMERELGLSADRLTALRDAETQALHGMISLARNLARDFPDCDVVLRPHPFEDPAPYVAGCPDGQGVTVDGSGPIQARLLQARAVIQRSCSTAAEAAMAGVPTLSPQWLPAPLLIPFAEAVSTPCGTYDGLRGVLQQIVSGSFDPAAQAGAAERVLPDWFGPLDGQAHQRVADAIRGHLPGKRLVDMRRCATHLYQLDGQPRATGARLAAHVRYALRLSPAWSFRRWQVADAKDWRTSSKGFGTTEVERHWRAIRAELLDAGQQPGDLRITPSVGRYARAAGAPAHSVTMLRPA